MVGTFLRTEGWIALDPGNDVSAAAFVDKALEVGARVISGMSRGNAADTEQIGGNDE